MNELEILDNNIINKYKDIFINIYMLVKKELERNNYLIEKRDNYLVKRKTLEEVYEELKSFKYEEIIKNKKSICSKLEYALGYDGSFLYSFENALNIIEKGFNYEYLYGKSIDNFILKFLNIFDIEIKRFNRSVNNINVDAISLSNKLLSDFIFSLKCGLPIKNDSLIKVKKILIKNNFSEDYITDCINVIHKYNNYVSVNRIYCDIEYFKDSFKIGYEIFPKIKLSDIKNQEIKNKVLSLYSLCNEYNNDFSDILPKYDESLYDEEYYKKIYYDLMIFLQTKFNNNILSCLDDDELCMNEVCRKELLKEYKRWLNIYINCRDFFESEISSINILDTNNNNLSSNFIFSMSENLSYFEKDLKSIPQEYYEKIDKLLYNKRYGQLSPTEDMQLVNSDIFKGYRELRSDQIRIIYKNLPLNSIYLFGVGVKKSDNDRNMYKKLTNRPFKYEKIYDDNLTYKRIIDYINNNKRKGNR